jgi:hypothetical protein
MRTASAISIVLIAGLSVATWTSQGAAQSSARDAAITRCITKAQKQYPRAGRYGTMSNRTFAYKACMTAAGFRP